MARKDIYHDTVIEALDKYVMYHQVLLAQNIDRELYLAIPLRTYQTIFQDELGKILLGNGTLRLLVFDEFGKVIVEWIPE